MLFIAPFPTPINNKDGLVQRVDAIDKFFSDCDRVYLEISFSKFLFPRVRNEGKVTIVQTNYFNFVWSWYFVRATTVYFHTIFGFLKTYPLSAVLKKKMILDLHGTVPEERAFEGSSRQKLFLDYFERRAFHHCSMFVYVTGSMRSFFLKKYPSEQRSKRHVLYPIVPVGLLSTTFGLNESRSGERTRIIYSGGLQKWQNIDLVIDCIDLLKLLPYDFLVLTNERDRFMMKLREKNLDGLSNLTVTSVKPEELGRYYQSAHYGFLLRDENLINKVACPTKAVEYMYYGLIPIVKFPGIGDFLSLGYEYITLDQLRSGIALTPRKSPKNHTIVSSMIQQSMNVNIRTLSDNL